MSAQLKSKFFCLIFQALEWIHDTGEFYLSTHTNVGESLAETESLLKEHNEFKVTAKVSVNFLFMIFINSETSLYTAYMSYMDLAVPRKAQNAGVLVVLVCSDNSMSPIRCQAIIRTSDDILLIRPYGTYFNEMLFEIQMFSFKKMNVKHRLQNVGRVVSASVCSYKTIQNSPLRAKYVVFLWVF